MDKLAKVRAEIEKRIDYQNKCIQNHYRLTGNAEEEIILEYKQLLAVIDSLQEEPVSDNLEQAAITAADEDMQGRQIMEESNEKRQLYSRIFRRGFKAGAKWQKAKDQAEKDLTLTNADVYDIWRLYNEVCAEGQIFGFDETSEEVLKRFNEMKSYEKDS